MQIPVLVEPVAGNGYRAKGGEPFGFTAEGATREEALRKLREQIDSRLSSGAQVVLVEVPAKDNPWLRMAGWLDKDDPRVKEWEQIIQENRQKADEDPDFL
jgi:hypothetical protein